MKYMKKSNSISFKIIILTVFIIFTSIFLKSVSFVKAQAYTNISAQEANSMINNSTSYPNLVILDVRSQGEYDAGHLCNATLVPLDELESRISELLPYNNTEIIVYCASGGRSAQASQILVNQGFTKIFNLQGGISGWISAGFEVCLSDDGNNGQSQPTIGFTLNFFVLIMIGTISIVILIYRKKKIKIN